MLQKILFPNPWIADVNSLTYSMTSVICMPISGEGSLLAMPLNGSCLVSHRAMKYMPLDYILEVFTVYWNVDLIKTLSLLHHTADDINFRSLFYMGKFILM